MKYSFTKNYPYTVYGLFIIVGIFVYHPVFLADFVWDDNRYITENKLVQSPQGLPKIWAGESETVNYWPVTLSAFWLQFQLWGMQPLGYHAVNLALHLLNGMLLFTLMHRWGWHTAGWLALFFTFHPLQVESVAWITELKNQLSGLFLLLCVRVAFPPLNENPTRKKYRHGASLLFAALSYLSKSSTYFIPFLIAYGLAQRKQLKDRKSLLFLAAHFILSAGLISYFLAQEWARQSQKDFGLHLSLCERGMIATRSTWFYLQKWFYPEPLLTLYPRWSLDCGSSENVLAAVSLLLFSGLLLVLFWKIRWFSGLALVAYLVLALAPISGIVQHLLLTSTYVADHFQYLALWGFLALLIQGAFTVLPVKLNLLKLPDEHEASHETLLQVNHKTGLQINFARLRFGLLTILLGLCCLLSYRQTLVYRNAETLWTHTLQYNPGSSMALYSLGLLSKDKNNWEAALDYFSRSLIESPTYYDALINKGMALKNLHRLAEAKQVYEQAIRLRPNVPNAWNNIGNVFLLEGQLTEAKLSFDRALAADANFSLAYVNRGILMMNQAQFDLAFADFNQAERLRSLDANVYLRRGWINEFPRADQTAACLDYQKACTLGQCEKFNAARQQGKCSH